MNKKIPEYLRLHREEPAGTLPCPTHGEPIEAACQSFSDLTGWRLHYRPLGTFEADAALDRAWSLTVGEDEADAAELVLTPDTARRELPDPLPANLDTVRPWAELVGGLITEVHRWRAAVWHREAELAAGIPVTIRTDEQRKLATHLESVLRGGAEAIGCQAAALYLLDDATSHLKLRACWQLPRARLLDPPRPLRGAVADLEALLGHAVALEDTRLLPHWKTPEDFPAALCVPVSTSSTPLGTLWFFADRTRPFGDEQTHLAEIVAGRIVADLEREVLIREGLRSRQGDEARELLSRWQEEQRPTVVPLVDGWEVAGRCVQQDRLGGQFYDWCILPDGRLAIALGHAEGPALEASFTATTLQIVLKSHAAHRHDARGMLERLNEALWSYSPGNRFASLFYALIDPDTGTMQYASAGSVHALLWLQKGTKCLAQQSPMLGSDPDTVYHQASRVIGVCRSLAVFTHRPLPMLDPDDDEPDEMRVERALRSRLAAPAEEQAGIAIDHLAAGASADRTVLVVRRTR